MGAVKPASRVAVSRWADRNRFGPEVQFADVRSVTLPSGGPRQSGLYLLQFDNESYYVGESVDLRSRMAGHKTKWGNEISTVRLLARTASKQELKRLERALTRDAEEAGIVLRNVLNASVAFGIDALDELLDNEAQERWRRDPGRFNADDTTPLKELSAQSVRYSTAADRYAELDREPEMTTLLKTYVEGCIPAPRATEFQYWSVSTGTYASSAFPRRFCVSVGKMEVFVLSASKRLGGSLLGFVNVRKSVLYESLTPAAFRKRHPAVRRKERFYEDGGGDTIALHCSDFAQLESLVADPDVRRAAGALVLDVMRKHFCIYTRYHCPQLVERLYPELTRTADLGGSSAQSDADLKIDEDVALSFGNVEDVVTSSTEDIEDIEDLGDVDLFWVVGTGSRASKKNQVTDFLSAGEWRMDLHPLYEPKVADMRVGERIAVRTRRNFTDDVPFDNRGHSVSAMEFHLRGVITHNPGDGCSVEVKWEAPRPVSPRFYLYTSQDAVWPMAKGRKFSWDQVIDFAFFDKPQNIDSFRNAPFWADRFGDTDRG
ncbi:GIY-YIG nuclease family protein [Rhodococcus sp. IEGM 1341]|uniref:GIY-YIG nuclease family protein n=1 Tax=Rhodococcus sp. IEGM 1341 TaxID=3047090 RepID=UPI0024B7EEAA|nr:GIY-YIG nuclease family protein [Rhodococcus sp. IEGM 1341]MDI9927420.1 GIY-YIG nuclease family protein [Rhodococcus sp. IEGM 1341]